MYDLRKWIGVLCVILNSFVVLHAQQDDVYVFGTARSRNGMPLKDTITVVARDTNEVSTVIVATVSRKTGYELFLPFGKVYRVDFDASGYVQQHVIIDLRILGRPAGSRSLGMKVDMALFPRVDGLDYSPCEKPIGLAYYSSTYDEVIWNEAYTIDSIKPEMDRLDKAYKATTRPQKRK
jgi:hypothetical protein